MINAQLDAELGTTLNQCGYDINRLNKGKKLVFITGHHLINFGECFINSVLLLKI